MIVEGHAGRERPVKALSGIYDDFQRILAIAHLDDLKIGAMKEVWFVRELV